ncbi:hypothetical protein BT96DRAFT_999397 [Gymnopus androsaceus JB14]|uniref:Uncharacterized protein n=1 Tax=Gymnopus androsaceus JB14 TaxID=1447944 RepID=A0A6A4H5Z4_9AGAR|nr:hypothetical protein BT96DRAFT_999397 [Gymnopus androsaceus JB14]
MAVRRYVTLFDSLFNLMDVPELEEAFNTMSTVRLTKWDVAELLSDTILLDTLLAKIPSKRRINGRVNDLSRMNPTYSDTQSSHMLKLKIDSSFKVPLSPDPIQYSRYGSSMRSVPYVR